MLGKVTAFPLGRLRRRKERRDYERGLAVFRKYDFVLCRGNGATSQVHEAVDRENEQAFAIKCVVKKEAEAMSHFKLSATVTDKWAILDHPNICRLHETFEDVDLRYFVMELCDGRTFFERLEEDIVLEEVDAARIGRQMFRAVAHLHDKEICHRDLKPESWLLMLEGPGVGPDSASAKAQAQVRVKLINFGLVESCSDEVRLMQPCGTLHYLAPEVLRGSYGKSVDNWTMGVVLFLALYAAYPFDGPSFVSVARSILGTEPEWSDSCYALSVEARGLLKQLLVKDPEARLTARGALEHSFFASGSRLSRVSSASRRSLVRLRAATSKSRLSSASSSGTLGPRRSQLVTSETMAALAHGKTAGDLLRPYDDGCGEGEEFKAFSKVDSIISDSSSVTSSARPRAKRSSVASSANLWAKRLTDGVQRFGSARSGKSSKSMHRASSSGSALFMEKSTSARSSPATSASIAPGTPSLTSVVPIDNVVE